MKPLVILFVVAGLAVGGLGPPAHARTKSKKAPAPMNKKVKFEPYSGTDIAMVTYLTSRQEFRVGHAPYKAVRFHVAEFVLVTEHTRKYLRPDFKAEIQMAPRRTQPELMANKTFQAKWKGLIEAYRKMIGGFKQLKYPKECKPAFTTYLAAMEDELALAQVLQKRMFSSQQIRARELTCADLKPRFRARNTEWFDRLCEDFEGNADLSKFYPRFVDLLVETELKKAAEQAEKAMQAVGLEHATAVKEEGDIVE